MGDEGKGDRDAEQGRGTVVVAMLIAVLGVLAVPWMLLRASADRAAAMVPSVVGVSEDDLVAGGKIYARSCVGCHKPRGEGEPGRYPPLVGARWLLDDKETAIRITLLGVSGTMDVGGQVYRGVMPNLGVTLTDEEIAQVLTFTRASWGNRAPAVTADDVAKVRASLANRTEPWAGGAALEEARKTRVLP